MWPVLRLRTILFATLLFVAALPGIGAVFLRVYENALVRRTEAELVAQSAALAAIAAVDWPGQRSASGAAPPAPAVAVSGRHASRTYQETPTEIDLSSSSILPPRPAATPSSIGAADGDAARVADHLLPAFQQTQQTTLSSIIMLDARGVVLTGDEQGRSLSQIAEVQSALSGRPMTTLRINANYGPTYAFEWLSRASNIRLHHARPVVVDGRVRGVILVSRSPRALFKGMYEDRGKIILGIVVIFLLLVMLSGVLVRAIVRPIENLSRATRALSSGQSINPVEPSLQVIEIRNLFRDFDAMAVSIDKRSRYLRDFATSVSHEFKTPLAAISGAIELLQDHADDMAKPDRDRFLANMAADAERLSRLVRRLMEQAQADLHRDRANGSTLAQADAHAIAIAVADGFRGARFAIAIDAAHPLPSTAIDGDALEAVLSTLVENARQAGAAMLTIRMTAVDEYVQFDLFDDGPGIPAGDRERIFDPFFTSKREQGGTGLGLSIAQSLLNAYGGTLCLLASERGAHFGITLPTATAKRGGAV